MRDAPFARRPAPARNRLNLKKRTVTIVDVARRAGVSVGTASQALNSPDLVGQERLARVNKAVAELGYTRNLLAQGLRAKQSPAIGLCGPHSRAGLFPALVYRFEQLAAANRRQILHVLSQEGSDRELQQVKTLVAYGVAGVLLVDASAGTVREVRFDLGAALATVPRSPPARWRWLVAGAALGAAVMAALQG